jgi:hypothetical protein
MTDDAPTIAHGDEYIAIYAGGPNDGRSDRRIATDDSWDTSITVNGLEDSSAAQFVYAATSVHTVGGQVQVTYSWDPAHSDALEDLDERND